MTATMQIHITAEMLRQHKACSEQIDLFVSNFPDGIMLKNKEHALRVAQSVAEVFDFEWAGENLLKGRFVDLYEEAMEQHRKAYQEA